MTEYLTPTYHSRLIRLLLGWVTPVGTLSGVVLLVVYNQYPAWATLALANLYFLYAAICFGLRRLSFIEEHPLTSIRLFLLISIIVQGFSISVGGREWPLFGAMGQILLVFLASLLEPARNAAAWTAVSVGIYMGALALNQLPTIEHIELGQLSFYYGYGIPIVLFVIATLMGRMLTRTQRDFLAESELQKRAIQEALEAERTANALIERVITTIGHEFRTPLTFIVGYSYMAEGAQTKEELMDYLRRMRLGIDRLEKLVEGFIFLNNLQVSNAKTEYNQNHKAFTDWHGLTEKVVEKYRPWAERQKITLNKTVHYDKLGVVIVHVDYLFDAISRLVDNAIKFTPAEGNIGVDVWSRD